jgi:hypothetical protein
MKMEISLAPKFLCIGTKFEKVANLGNAIRSVVSGRVTILMGILVLAVAASLNLFFRGSATALYRSGCCLTFFLV